MSLSLPQADILPPHIAPRPPTSAGEVVAELHVEADVRTGLARWRELEGRLASDGIPYASSADWAEIWLRHYGDVCPHKILTATVRQGSEVRVVGVTLVSQSRIRKGPFVLRQWHLGTAGEPAGHSVCVEYNRVLADPAWRSEVHTELAHWLKIHGRDGVALDGLAPEAWSELEPHFPSACLQTAASKFCDLTKARAAGTDVLSQLGRSTRQNLRRKLRDYGDIETTWADDVPTALAILDELIELHQARWIAVGKPGAFSSPRFAAFQRELVTKWIPQRRIVAFRTRHQGETVGCLVLLVDGKRILDYFSGFVSFDKKPSPGMVTHLLCMQEALARGFDAYDFLVGEKQHKDNLSTDEHRLTWATWQPNTWKLRAFRAARSWKYAALRLLGRDADEGPACDGAPAAADPAAAGATEANTPSAADRPAAETRTERSLV